MTSPAPWWANDPILDEIRRSTAATFGIELDARDFDLDDHEFDVEGSEPAVPEGPDLVLSEILVGNCGRELAEARNGLAAARDRYDTAVLKARSAGWSWGEIGNVLGVSGQQLHRRFSTPRRR